MSSSANALQQAIYAALTGDATLMALIAGVYDRVPEQAAFPYVTLGEDTLTDWSTFGRLAEQGTVTLHTWSQDQGKKEAKTIMDRIDTVLNRQAVTVSGFTLVGLVREFQQTVADPDGITSHGVQRFRVWVQA